jgi:hypothetical protein
MDVRGRLAPSRVEALGSSLRLKCERGDAGGDGGRSGGSGAERSPRIYTMSDYERKIKRLGMTSRFLSSCSLDHFLEATIRRHAVLGRKTGLTVSCAL